MLDSKPLEALAAVVEHGGFGPAAQALSITLAAVSLRIKSLEAALGQRLLVRGKRVRATPAGQALLAHVKQVQMMEADLLAGLSGGTRQADWQRLAVAINADSVAAWFLPGVAPMARQHRLLLDVLIDDQDHTHDALSSGEVVGCVTTLATPMRGCVAEPLGIMRYRCVATPEVAQRCRTPKGLVSPHRLLALPAVIFNRKDALQDTFLAQHFGLRNANYPRHFAPAIDAFERAIELGLGWGMVPELHLANRQGLPELVDVLPGAGVDVALYWQHWGREPLSAQRLTQAVKAAARACLPPLPSASAP
jgi:LysR family transcriptional regulator, chromosome initiation inhibitor